ncbi:hypothetical protein ACWDO0_28120 [Nocardia rhamnosiphila]
MRNAMAWIDRRPWWRRCLWTFLVVVAMTVFPGLLGAVATAQVSSGVSEIDGLSWMNIRDSDGVPLATYTFAGDKGSLLDPGNTVLWTVISLEFIGYLVIVTTAIWLIGYAFSFRWLDHLGDAFTGVAEALARQTSTPVVVITAATLGAFFAAWFIVRGFYSKAAIQVVTMLAVAVFGAIFLAHPLAHVLSSDGLLTQGRDVGLSVAAGLNGDNNPNPDRLVTEIQHDLADNFARKPIQVWNFGHIVDNVGGCESAWSSAVLSGDDGRVRTAMRRCGNETAYTVASAPGMGQVGTGIVLLICATVLLAFAIYLALKVMKAAMNSIYHGFMAIFGFAAGGFVYGPSQTFLIRNIVDAFVAAARMTAFTVFLGIYVLFLGHLFDQARGQVISVIVIACVVEIVAITQINRLNSSLSRGNDWVANRFALAIGGTPGGPGKRSALGMGPGTGGSKTKAAGLPGLATLGAVSTVNSSPITAWLMAATPSPLMPHAHGKKHSALADIRTADSRVQMYHWGQLGRSNWLRKAHARADPHGGMTVPIGIANALDGLGDSRVPHGQITQVLRAGGAPDERVHQALRAAAAMNASMSSNPYGWAPLQKALAASRAVENHLLPTDSLSTRQAFAAQALVAADNFARHTSAPPAGAPVNHSFINRVRQHWDSDIALRNAITADEWNAVGRDTRWAIATQAAAGFHQAARDFQATPSEVHRRSLAQWSIRIANLDHLDPAAGLDPWDS